MNNSMDFLLWVKGPAFEIALFIFVAGILIRVIEILLLGRKADLSEARSSDVRAGIRTVLNRSIPESGILKKAPFVIIVGYLWHICWFISFFLFVPHIEVINYLLGISWPGLPNQFVDTAAVIAMISLLAMLIYRFNHPVLRFISTREDYLVWLVTFLPLLSGYFAFHHTFEPYAMLLGLHILSVELFLVIFPFTKLMHVITVLMARWYNGVSLGRKEPENQEVQS
ncbi:MAG: respiratory nitrate reductase subunit gamma [gamma proteobacterium symbiont of Taylorina sp.]|nr:respiratory nitrate reductase subunit gamma [gamma proteobacterium symbiont of Taylorina sp.]